MALQIYPEATASGSSVAGKAYTLTWQNVYKTTDSFPAGIYTITTSPTSYQAKAEFVLSNNTIVTATTVSGTVTVSLATAATEVYFTLLDSNGSGITTLTITQTAATINTGSFSGTLDTITTSGTYNQTGKLYVVAVGGGGNGAGSSHNSNAGAGGGGGSGAVDGKLFYTNSPTTITIGAGGGGTTNFGNLLSAPGGQSGSPGGDQQGRAGDGGSPYGGSGGKGALNGGAPQNSNSPSPSASPYVTIVAGTTGGGGGGGASGKAATNGAGSGIGTGGDGGSTLAVNGGNANGYGAGGGGGGARSAAEVNTNGGLGTQGVVYVLRGF